jgi:hypothetical protein
MKKALVVIIALFCASIAQAQTPGFVEAGSWSSSGPGNGQHGRTSWLDPCSAGNAILIGSQFAAGAGVTSSSWADDASGSYPAVVPQPGSADARQVVNLFYNSSCGSGASKLTMTIAGGTPSYVDHQASVFYNLGALDASCHATATSATASCSMTTTASGDLVACYVVEDSSDLSPPGFTPASSFVPDLIDLIDPAPQMMMHQVQASAGAITPMVTLSKSSAWNIVCGAWKAASSGSAPSGMYVAHFMGMNLLMGGGTTYTSYPFPASGNLLVVTSQTGSDDMLCTAAHPDCVSDSNANSWATCGGTGQGLVGVNSQIYCAQNAATGGRLTITWSMSSDAAADNLMWYDIAGASASAFDQRGTNTGTQSTTGALATASVTPTTKSGMTIWTLGVYTDTVPGISAPTGAIFDCVIENPTQQDDPGCQNNANGHYAYSSARRQIWSVPGSVEGTRYWTWWSIADTFRPSGAGREPASSLGERRVKLAFWGAFLFMGFAVSWAVHRFVQAKP